jgi:hypothetical protein
MNIDIRYDVNRQYVLVVSSFFVEYLIKIYSYDGEKYVINYKKVHESEPFVEYFFNNDFIDKYNIKVEIWDPRESFMMRECYFKHSAVKPKRKICVISPIKNEIAILPFFIDYYLNFVKADKIVFADGNSDDGSVEYIKSFGDKTEIISENHVTYSEYDIMRMRNTIWKKYKDDYDWIIIVDADEFLYHPYISDKLEECMNNGITIPSTNGYEMMDKTFPIFTPKNYLTNFINKGFRKHGMDKAVIFNPKEVDMKYSFGSHQSYPTGNVVHDSNTELKLLHYKFLSLDYLRDRGSFGVNRRSEKAIVDNQAAHWVENSVMSEEEYDRLYNKCEIVI